MDLRKLNKFTSADIAQLAPPRSFELAGQTFDFVMDDGTDYRLRFIDKTSVEWTDEGSPPRVASDYLCAKSDDTTYLVSYELGDTPRANHTFVIDLENRLVTKVTARVGENKRYPYLITPRYEFGAIRREGEELPFRRHGYTSDAIGNIIQWNYGSMETVHIYYCADFYRITYPPQDEGFQMFNEAMSKLPSPDEPTVHIKIKEGVYLFSLTEANMERVLGAEMPFRSNTMCFIQDYRSVRQIGRGFGTLTFEAEPQPLHLLFGAVGKILEPDSAPEYIKKLLSDPNPFLV
ncbi:MAG: MoaF N-terminal domain-containing protein [Oscillospiraceae bacterium]|jgi:hypothetical protein|nr:MoaF N-terminal domain-containing protein [Oscillospiraceae bacterium]